MASKVKEAFMGDKGLSGVVRKAPLEKVFEIKNVKQVSTGTRRHDLGAPCDVLLLCLLHGANALSPTMRQTGVPLCRWLSAAFGLPGEGHPRPGCGGTGPGGGAGEELCAGGLHPAGQCCEVRC